MPTQRLPRSLSQGLVRSRDASTLKDGELTVATGCEYRVGSPHLYKREGRTDSGAALGSAVTGVRVANFDTTSDKLIAVAGTSIYEGTPSTTPAFGSAVVTGLTSGAIPTFAQAQDRLVFCNGADQNYIREPDGTWRRSLQPATFKPVATLDGVGGNEWRVTGSGTGGWSDGSKAGDVNGSGDGLKDTFAWAQIDKNNSATHVWTFASQAATDPNVRLEIEYTDGAPIYLFGIPINQGIGDGYILVEYSLDYTASTPTWTELGRAVHPLDRTPLGFTATGVTNLNQIGIRLTAARGNLPGPYKIGRVFDIWAYNGGTEAYTSAYPVKYACTEIYYDSDNVEHESAAFGQSDDITLSSTYGATITLPTTSNRINPIATHVGIYRTVAIDGGGWPTAYRIDVRPIADATFIDPFSPTNDPRAVPDAKLYDVVTILSSDGETQVPYDLNVPPPISKLAVSFQGSMVYLPGDDQTDLARKAFYSQSSALSNVALEQVPRIYFLQFDTPYNDSPTTCVPCNGGRALAFFFDRYTMFVAALPQATDSGVFDSRVKEYISTSRGSAGVQTACEFTLPSGQTLVASADSLGLWVTNGVSEIMEWSNDFDWLTEMSGVTLSTARLRDNPIKRRLELIYTKSGQNYELHFFYGRLKQDADGKTAPLITGPHKANISDAHYFNVGGSWRGWSAGTSASGKVYNELTDTTDAALSYDSSGSIPFVAKTGDNYVTGLGGSHLIEALYPKFESGTASVTVASTVTRDAGTSRTITNTFAVGTAKKLFHHAYADRHSVQFSHITATSMPALVGYEIEVRDGGVGRDR